MGGSDAHLFILQFSIELNDDVNEDKSNADRDNFKKIQQSSRMKLNCMFQHTPMSYFKKKGCKVISQLFYLL